MNKNAIILGVIAIVVLLFVGWIIGTYNSLVTLEEEVNGQWANVESSYQRRLDLIPNLVNTVQGAADFEQETLTQLTELRSQAVSAQSSFAGAGDAAAQLSAINQGESVLTRFFAVMEAYPTVTATQNFRDLQVQLEGTENRINVARNRYNDAVKTFNAKIRRFPASVIAGMFGFEKKDFFEADEGAEAAPQVEF